MGVATTALLDPLDDADDFCDAVVLALEPLGVGDDAIVAEDPAFVAPAPGLRLTLTPTLPQSCCAKAVTSGGKGNDVG